MKFWLLLVCSLVAIYGSFVLARHLRIEDDPSAAAHLPASEPIADGPPLTEFTLTNEAGQPFDSASLRGKVWVASFFFTNCPAVCWRLNQTLAALQQTEKDSDVRYVSITCDPQTDTPEALAKYAQHFKADPARWTFLTGDMNLIQRIGRDFFRISVEHETHSDRACVVDRKGQVRGRFRLTQPDQVELLKRLLITVAAEEAPNGGDETPGEPAEAPAHS
jgi:protein SCO1/2